MHRNGIVHKIIEEFFSRWAVFKAMLLNRRQGMLDKKKILAMLGDGSLGGKIEGTLGNPRIGKHNTGMF